MGRSQLRARSQTLLQTTPAPLLGQQSAGRPLSHLAVEASEAQQEGRPEFQPLAYLACSMGLGLPIQSSGRF